MTTSLGRGKNRTVQMTDVIEVPDRYMFVREIHAGSFGSVVELIENSTQEHYAGKMIPCVTAKDTERIDREVNRLLQFAHPGIVGLKELASMGNMRVIVMELGVQSLADIVRDHTSRGVLVAREIVYRVMVDISSALQVMHNESRGATAHGDVKMENILQFDGGHFKLCDLGAAESEDVSSTSKMMSQLYVSPERMESETGRATCSSDVWALGIVLHWLLFGEAPFKSQNAARLFREIGSFQVSMIGTSCGSEERALLMRMLDPNPGTRVTSSQLCSFGVFRCLVNTPSAVWKLKDDDENKSLDQQKKQLEIFINLDRDLRSERSAHKKTANSLRSEQARVRRLEEELMAEKEKVARLERELAESRLNQTRPPLPSAPPTPSRQRGSPPPQRRQGTVIRSQIGAAAIELFDQNEWTVSGNVFSLFPIYRPGSLISFEFGKVVARLSLTIRKGPNHDFIVGIISSSLSKEALTQTFTSLKGGAGWQLFQEQRSAIQNRKMKKKGSACLAGRKGQRVVVEADGREGKRKLKLSQDGETQPTFFVNIPVPFRFCVFLWNQNDAVEIESVEVVDEPQIVGGSVPVMMDE